MLRRAKRPTTKYSPFSPPLEQQRCGGDGRTDGHHRIACCSRKPSKFHYCVSVDCLTHFTHSDEACLCGRGLRVDGLSVGEEDDDGKEKRLR